MLYRTHRNDTLVYRKCSLRVKGRDTDREGDNQVPALRRFKGCGAPHQVVRGVRESTVPDQGGQGGEGYAGNAATGESYGADESGALPAGAGGQVGAEAPCPRSEGTRMHTGSLLHDHQGRERGDVAADKRQSGNHRTSERQSAGSPRKVSRGSGVGPRVRRVQEREHTEGGTQRGCDSGRDRTQDRRGGEKVPPFAGTTGFIWYSTNYLRGVLH